MPEARDETLSPRLLPVSERWRAVRGPPESDSPPASVAIVIVEALGSAICRRFCVGDPGVGVEGSGGARRLGSRPGVSGSSSAPAFGVPFGVLFGRRMELNGLASSVNKLIGLGMLGRAESPGILLRMLGMLKKKSERGSSGRRGVAR